MNKYKVSRPQVSIIIPAFNEDKYISKCLESILKQETNMPFETIVVNNNSTDKTKAIAKEKGFKVIDESRQGVTIAKNTGAKVAKGNLLFFLDADCVIPFDYIEKIISFFKDNPKVDALGGPYIYYDGGVLVRWFTDNLNYYTWYFKVMKWF
ncbi:glycosyltransferase family 2 protein [Patescibacteria group bacterium]|nr:glycosyltransferase family 2 protein [Patescibacteria group bacterium]